MALSDCVKCWETPCACGYEYRAGHWTIERLKMHIAMLQRELAQKEKERKSGGHSQG